MFTFLATFPQAEPSEQAAVIVVDLHERWKHGSGTHVEQYLERFPQLAADENIKVDLIVEEYGSREEQGERLNVGEFAARFPDLKEALMGQLADLAAANNVDCSGETQSPTALTTETARASHGTHVRCPHCHNRIEVTQDVEFRDLSCPSCGSEFNLINPATATHQKGRPRFVANFELLENVGVRQFGSVWKARDKQLDRVVAIKIPRGGNLDARDAGVFLHEARAAARLRHPSIVPVHEVGRSDDGTIYIVSDYVQGANLKEWLAAQRPTARESAALCAQLADALHHAHVQGVVHRDLKPANMMMDRSGDPRIMDFGLAKREAAEVTMTVEGHVIGTPAYMSPEQAAGMSHDADQRSDVYSLGVILFELLTGEVPCRGGQRMLIMQILEAEPPSPRQFDNRIPKDLETVCLKCLEKDPAKRYQSAEELREDLQHYLDGEPIRARPIGQFERIGRWCQRKERISQAGIAGVVVGTIVVGLNVLGALFWLATSQRAARPTEWGVQWVGTTLLMLAFVWLSARVAREQIAAMIVSLFLMLSIVVYFSCALFSLIPESYVLKMGGLYDSPDQRFVPFLLFTFMAVTLVCLPFVLRCRKRIVANVDSIGFVVRK